ncbi:MULTISPECIES: hypothetical protein [Acinetobacter]|jgi:hypothetical protein|uniref:hypothetical protein n=1 Tax=Acinetobacter TaxID=469 RepID=UPI0009727CE8|nr:hypothetical protein AsACE_p100004 [Acinetobacter schindleri]MBB4836609.1 hypothetical protein [Acinetobacter schindleri]
MKVMLRITLDLELFKHNLNQIPSGTFVLTDRGYQRIYTLYPNTLLPLKAKSRCKLDPELKIYNQEINKEE